MWATLFKKTKKQKNEIKFNQNYISKYLKISSYRKLAKMPLNNINRKMDDGDHVVSS